MDNTEQSRVTDRLALLARSRDLLIQVSRRGGHGSSTLSPLTSFAESLVRSFTNDPPLHDTLSFAERAEITQALQSVAFDDPRATPSAIIVRYCAGEWARLVEMDVNSIAALSGMAQFYWFMAEPVVNSIGDTTSHSSGSGESIQGGSPGTLGHHDGENIHGSQQYIAARAFLFVATDFYDRAIEAHSNIAGIPGSLWREAIDAWYSLAFVSPIHHRDRPYERVIQLVRLARSHGHAVIQNISDFYDEYGRYFDNVLL